MGSGEPPDVQAEGSEPNLDESESTHLDRDQPPMVTMCETTFDWRSYSPAGLWRLDRSIALLIDGEESARITTTLDVVGLMHSHHALMSRKIDTEANRRGV